MSPLGLYISNWLANGPGLIQGSSPDDLWAKAHLASGLEHHATQQEFIDALDRAGYRAQPRRFRGENVWVLALPEKFKGM